MENVKRYLTQGKIPEYRESNKPEFCPILGGRTNDWVVDHDHKSGMVRGVISRLGNSLVGKVENFLYNRCSQKAEDFPKILRNIALYLERENTEVLHPVGLTQLTKRFKNNLTAGEQYDLLRNLGGDEDLVSACKNSNQRASLFRTLTKNQYESNTIRK